MTKTKSRIATPGELSLTERLQMLMRGDPAVMDGLLDQVLQRLRKRAPRELKWERDGAPLAKPGLIHELWLNKPAESRESPILCLKFDPMLDTLQTMPAFLAFERREGVEP